MNQDIARRSLMLGATAAAATRPARAQPRAPINLSFWTFEQPQQRGWLQKRVRMYQEQNPHIRIDFQWFTFSDLSRRLSVGYSTGTAPDGFVSQDWFMPLWLSRGLIAPMDVQRLGYANFDAFVQNFNPAFVSGATQEGRVFGYPLWFYGFCNYINERHFQEAGIDPNGFDTRNWEGFGEAARRLTIREGSRFVRQGFKFAMHSPQWTMAQFNPILADCGGHWFDEQGRCTVNSEAGIRAMTIRASIARTYGAEDPADSIATPPLPQMDWLRERAAMFFCHPIPPQAIESQNPTMLREGYFRPVEYPGVRTGPGLSTTCGFNLVVNARAPQPRQEAMQDFYRFVMSDLVDCWRDTGPFTLAHRGGWTDHPEVQNFPHVRTVIRATERGLPLPRTLVYNELADAMHRAVQRIMLNNGDIAQSLNMAAAETDRATAAIRRG